MKTRRMVGGKKVHNIMNKLKLKFIQENHKNLIFEDTNLKRTSIHLGERYLNKTK